MKSFAKPGKYKAVPSDISGRPYDKDVGGVRYDSKAEAAHARRLDLLKAAGQVRWWLRQVPVMIGEPGVDRPYRVDFVVCEADGSVHAEEVKGAETAQFKRQKRQWAKRGPFPLHIIKGKKVETIEPEGDDAS